MPIQNAKLCCKSHLSGQSCLGLQSCQTLIFAVEEIMSAHRIGLSFAALFAVSVIQPNVALSQGAPQASSEVKPVGKVLTAEGGIRIEHPTAILVQANLASNGPEQTKIGDLVYRGDIIQTGPDGKLGVAFTDGSSFSVSPNARMEIKEFVYDPHGHFNSSLISLTKGTFTLIAGKIADTGNMTVATPVGTLRIRDIAPRIEISKDGSVKFSTLVQEK